MKKIFAFSFLTLFAFCIYAYDAEVLALDGKAMASSNGSSWTALSVGSKIAQGSIIQTAFKSSLKLKLKGSQIDLGPMTRISLDELSEGSERDNAVLSMKTGSVTSNVKKIEDRRVGFTIKGPAATASVRGTIFSEACGYNGDTVTAIESQTAVWPSQNQQSQSLVAAGQETSVNASAGKTSAQSKAAAKAADLGAASVSMAQDEAVGALDGAAPLPSGPAGGLGGGTGAIAVAISLELD